MRNILFLGVLLFLFSSDAAAEYWKDGLFKIDDGQVTEIKGYDAVLAAALAPFYAGTAALNVGSLTVIGDFSCLGLSDNAADNNSIDNYGLRFIAGVPYVRLDTVSVPIMLKGINMDLAAIYGSTTNPITEVFGVALDYPAVISVPAPEVYPYQPKIALEGGRYAVGLGYKHQGAAVEWDATGYYTASLLTEGASTSATVNSGGYLNLTTNTTADHFVYYPTEDNIDSFEIVGVIDCSASAYTSGDMFALQNLTLNIPGFPSPQVGAGYYNVGANGSATTYVAYTPAGFVTSAVLLSAGPIVWHATYTRLTATTVAYSVEINGTTVAANSNYSLGFDVADYDFVIKTHAKVAAGATGTADIKDYGWFATYHVAE